MYDLDGQWGWFKRNWKGVAKAALGVGALTFCSAICGAGLAIWGAYSTGRALADKRYKSAAWEAAGVASFGYATKLRYASKAAARGAKYSHSKASALRVKSGSTHRRHKARAKGHSRRLSSYRSQARRLRYADYGNWYATTVNDARSWR